MKVDVKLLEVLGNYEREVTFKNMLCPHLRYESGSTCVRFSVWRGMLELLQIFQDRRTTVRQLWQSELIFGFLDFEKVVVFDISNFTGGIRRYASNDKNFIELN